MNLDRDILRNGNIPSYLLGIFFLVAGLSKLVILEYWTGYEPAILVNLLPLTSDQFTLAGGIFEALIGFGLLLERKKIHMTAIATLWLTAITLQVARIGLWDLAIRDIGLVFFAISVMIYSSKIFG